MNAATWQRLFGTRHAFDEPAVVVISILLVLGLSLSPLVILGLDRAGKLEPALRDDLWRRYRSWMFMVPVITLPILLGAFWAILAVCALSVLCFREFARATGFFREKLMNLLVVLGIFALTFACLDHWYRMFVALTPLIIVVIAAVSTSLDQPKGYIQRVAMASLGFLLFGTCLGHMGYLANDAHYRSLMLLLIFCIQTNDVFAYIVGKSIGGPKLAPQTSPNKTISGSLGALALTTVLIFVLGDLVFPEGPMHSPWLRLLLGMVISIAGQLGDLTVSAIKRDAGVKDTGNWIPGHGGVLDRANSLLLSAPALFHYLNYEQTIGFDQAVRIFTGGG
jgi:phosphatidate cytidylyltransferase